jgi:hypothetical protein
MVRIIYKKQNTEFRKTGDRILKAWIRKSEYQVMVIRILGNQV